MNNSLFHWGIPGMHWGVRRRSSGKSSANKVTSNDHAVANKLKKKHISQLTNDELKQLTTRMQLEKQFKDLSKSDISSGQKFVTEIIGNAGKQLASKYVASAVEQGLPVLLKILKTTSGG